MIDGDNLKAYLTGGKESLESNLAVAPTDRLRTEIGGRLWSVNKILTELDAGTFDASVPELPSGPARARKRAPQTSKDAAASLSSGIMRKQHAVLLKAYAAASDGLTNSEMAKVTGLSGDSIRPRRVELAEKGLVMLTGETRTTSTGRQAEVFAITFKGSSALRQESKS